MKNLKENVFPGLAKNFKSNRFPILAGLTAIGIIGGCFSTLWWWSQQVGLSDSATSPSLEASAAADASAPVPAETPPLKTIPLKAIEPVPEGLYNYGGSTTVAPLRQALEPAIQETFPNFQLRYTNPAGKAPGSGTGIKMLIDGQLSFSESSRPLKVEEYSAAEQRGFSLEQVPIAIDGIAIAVSPQLALDSLTLEQLRDIYLGQITNWSELGGPDLAIRPLSRPPSAGGTPEFFIENILDGADFDSRVEIFETTTTALREVATSPNSLYYASAPEVVPQCLVKTLSLALDEKTPAVAPYQAPFADLSNCPKQRNQLNTAAFRDGSYPLTRRLFVIVKKDASTDESAGRFYSDVLLTAEGQALVEQAGFVSIR
ncbi:MAG: PstS family phosphate ABC transporter substrate-binding protein [Cyanobacteria bacterium P01_A01_bin.114]